MVFAIGPCGIVVAQSQSLSLTDYDRSLRKNRLQDSKHPPRVYDNDNLPSADVVSVVGSALAVVSYADKPGSDGAENDTASGSDAKRDPNQKNDHTDEIRVGQSPDEREKAYAEWKKRINHRTERVDQLARELQDLKHNAPTSVAVLHLWPDDQMYLQVIAKKQKELDQARDDLIDLQERARKAGVPASFREGDDKISPSESADQRKKVYADAISQAQAQKAEALSGRSGAENDIEDADETTGGLSAPMKDKPDQDQKKAAEIKPGQSLEEREKAYADWKKRIQERGDKIDQLTRQLDDLKQNVPTAVILHLWPEDQIYLQIVADKQKALDQARANLSDLQDEARKAGVPSSFRY